MNLEKNRLTEDSGFAGRGWICDKCGHVIENASDGWVQWREFGAESKTRKLRGEHALGVIFSLFMLVQRVHCR